MKICHVVENLNTGGLETVVIAMVKQQLKTGHECIVICLFEKGELAYKLNATNAQLFECHKGNGFDWHAIKVLRKTIKAFSPDIVHTHNNVAHIYTCLSMSLLPCAVVNSKHGLGAKSTLKQNVLFKLTWLKTSMFVFVSKDAMHSYIERGMAPKNRSIVLHNGVDIGLIPRRNNEARMAYLRESSINGNPVLACMVSRLNKLKDHHTLLQAFSLLKRDKSNCHLVMIGDGQMKAQIQNEITDLGLGDTVTLLGNKQDAYTLLQCFDLFVLSSHSEGHSIALLEAAAAGLPLIATNVGGNSEIVNEDTGYLVEHKDVDGLARVINLLVNDSVLRNKKGDNAQQWAEDNASIAAMTAAYVEVYSQATGKQQ